MKFAVIAPPHVLQEIGYPSSYHLALAQELLRDAQYLQYYQRASLLGHFVIVDNGAAENDTPPFDKVLRVANTVHADEVALPDVLRDKEATVSQTLSWAPKVPKSRRFIIPQGDTVEEWCQCLEELHLALDREYATIGVPKHLERFPMGRMKALQYLLDNGYWAYNIHLLGVWSHTFSEIFKACQIPIRVRGIDTGAPVAQAQQGNLITHSQQRRHSLDWNAPANAQLVHRNISSVMFWTQSMHHGERHG